MEDSLGNVHRVPGEFVAESRDSRDVLDAVVPIPGLAKPAGLGAPDVEVRLFVSQRNHRVDPRGAASRNETRRKRHKDQKDSDRNRRQGVMRTDVVEHRG